MGYLHILSFNLEDLYWRDALKTGCTFSSQNWRQVDFTRGKKCKCPLFLLLYHLMHFVTHTIHDLFRTAAELMWVMLWGCKLLVLPDNLCPLSVLLTTSDFGISSRQVSPAALCIMPCAMFLLYATGQWLTVFLVKPCITEFLFFKRVFVCVSIDSNRGIFLKNEALADHFLNLIKANSPDHSENTVFVSGFQTHFSNVTD